MESMEHDFMGRGYLLPPGCKDLIDAMKLKAMQLPLLGPAHLLNLSPPQLDLWLGALKKAKHQVFVLKKPIPPPDTLPPVVGEIVIPEKTSVSQLATLLGQKPFQIVADILELRVLATPNEPLSFEIISKVARKYGFFAIKAAY